MKFGVDIKTRKKNDNGVKKDTMLSQKPFMT